MDDGLLAGIGVQLSQDRLALHPRVTFAVGEASGTRPTRGRDCGAQCAEAGCERRNVLNRRCGSGSRRGGETGESQWCEWD